MSGARILVVEDERITAEDIKSGLESVEYDVVDIVSSGEDAIKKAEEHQPDLILMDIKLEGEMDGIEAAEQIRERFGIPVIYLTAYGDENTVQRAKITEPAGYILKEPFGFIRKPFEESELHTAIEITLYRARIEKRLRNHEQWMAAIIESINDAVIATDSIGQIKFMNSVAEDLTGWRQEEAIGKDFSEVFTVLSEETQPIREILSNMDSISIKNAILTSKNEKEKFIDGNVTPLKAENGAINGLVLVFRSTT